MTFDGYLHAKKYSQATVSCYTIYIQRFLNWLTGETLHPETFTYTELLDFMRHCQDQGVTKRTLNSMLCIIRHYCNHLISEGKRNDNPAAGVFIRGLVRKLPTNLLSFEEMEELYKGYSIQLHVDPCKKIMLGLMIYQGLSVGEITRLQSHHIKIKEGKVFIMGTKQTSERLLNLQAVQVAALQQYVSENKFKEGKLFTEPRKKQTSLLNINNRIQYMFSQLKQLNQKVINARQIRSSVITHWLGGNNLRQVQYMAGHKYVSSTERYQINNLDDLKNELEQHHPMK